MKYTFSSLAILLLASAVGCGTSNPDPLPDAMAVGKIRGGGGGGGSAAAASGPAAVVGDGWGALKGTFLYAGDPPTPKQLSTGGKDAQVCDVHPILDESLIVDAQTKGIRDIVVFARKVTRVNDDAKKPLGEQIFDQKNCVFTHHVLAVVTGFPVIIKNSDPVGHNTNLSPPGDVPSNNLLPGGSQLEYTFSRAQNDPVPVSCTIHSWMKAFMLPRKDTYVGVTKADGSFEIANLPAGEPVEFQVWHPKQPKLAAKPEWSQGRFTITIPKDGVQDLGQIQVPPAAL